MAFTKPFVLLWISPNRHFIASSCHNFPDYFYQSLSLTTIFDSKQFVVYCNKSLQNKSISPKCRIEIFGRLSRSCCLFDRNSSLTENSSGRVFCPRSAQVLEVDLVNLNVKTNRGLKLRYFVLALRISPMRIW